MFPIPSNQPLSFAKIANYWPRQISFPTTPDEALNELTRAWWRGEFIANGAERRNVLEAIYKSEPPFVAFGLPQSPDPHISVSPNGTVEVQFLVPLPNSEPKTWDDDNCLVAYRAVADAWESRPDIFELLVPVVRSLELTEEEFTKWLTARKWPRPTFWDVSEGLGKSSSLPKSLSEQQAVGLAQEYSQSAKNEGQTPTLLGFERCFLKGRGVRGNREKLRAAFRKLNGPAKRGRPTKQA
jgi:hypothetical protein